jgi:tetratricopeptide (TPR) repeat protein
VAGRAAVLGPEHVDTLQSLISLGNTLEGQGRLPEAESVVRKALKGDERILAEDSPNVLMARNNLAGILAKEGRIDEAEHLIRPVVALRIQTLGPNHPDTIHSIVQLASILMMHGSFDEAEQLCRTAQGAELKVHGTTPDTALLTYTMACIAARKGQPSEALALLRQAINQGLIPNIALDIANDKSLSSLHSFPDFHDLVALAGQRAATK